MTKGPLIILSGPSGAGKSTVVRRLLEVADLPLRQSVSATTRPPRDGEQDGVDYWFWTAERFQQELDAGAFLEWAEVSGNRYGTLRQEVDGWRRRGVGVVLVIDVQGAEQVRRQYPDSVSVFLRAPSWEAYEERLRRRGTEGEAALRRRLDTARRELARAGEYDHQLVNDEVGAAAERLRTIVQEHWERGDHAG